MYLATTVTFFISIVPIIPPYLVCVPWVVAIGISSSLVKAAVLFAIQYVAFTVLDDMLYEKSIVAVNSYVSALSVVFGVYVFGFEVCTASLRGLWTTRIAVLISCNRDVGCHFRTADCLWRLVCIRRVQPRHPSRARRPYSCIWRRGG